MTTPLTYFHAMIDYSISLNEIKFGVLMIFLHFLFAKFVQSQSNIITAIRDVRDTRHKHTNTDR